MAFFKKISQGIDNLKNKNKEKDGGGGQRLGSASETYDVGFSEDKLRITLNRGPQDRPVIGGVERGGEADRGGVRPGHVIVAVEGNPVSSFDDVMAILGALGRPITITFKPEKQRASAGPSASAKKSGGGGLGAFGQKKRAPPPTPLTPEQRAEQRAAALAAAEARGKQWEKRSGGAKRADRLAKKADGERRMAGPAGDPSAFSEETRRLIEVAKRREADQAARLGYNPYQVQMSSNQQARAAIVGGGGGGGGGGGPALAAPSGPASTPPAPAPAPGAVAPPADPAGFAEEGDPEVAAHNAAEAELVGAAVEHALGPLLSQDLEVSKEAIATMMKMVSKILESPGEEKYRKIRLGNKGFNAKVGSIDGGVETMQAIGFQLDTPAGENEPFLVYPTEEAMDGVKLRVGLSRLKAVAEMMAAPALPPGGGGSSLYSEGGGGGEGDGGGGEEGDGVGEGGVRPEVGEEGGAEEGTRL